MNTDGLDQQLFLAAEIVMRESRRNAGLLGDFGHGDCQRAMIADHAHRGINKRLAAHRFHSDFRHLSSPRLTSTVFLID